MRPGEKELPWSQFWGKGSIGIVLAGGCTVPMPLLRPPSLEPPFFLLPADGQGWSEQFPMLLSHHASGLRVRFLLHFIRQVFLSFLVTSTA